MTPQEQQMIDALIARIRTTQITDRDPEVAAHLQQGLGNNPDALYILAQTVLVQQHSLEQAHTQLEQAESELQQAQARTQPAAVSPSTGGNWLTRFFGDTQQQPQQGQPYANSPATYTSTPQSPYGAPVYAGAPPAYPPAGYPPSGYAPQGYPSPPYGQPGYGYGAPQSWTSGGGSFLRNAAQTAAGVAAGEMLFQGIESMFGGHHQGGWDNQGSSVTNNYYEDRPTTEHHTPTDTDSSFYNPAHDASRDTATPEHHFAENPTDSFSNDNNNDADTFADDSNSFDDTSGFDDTSTFDDSGSDSN